MVNDKLDDYISSKLENFNEEDNNYYKPKSLEDWYDNWDFEKYDANIYNHGLHQYPARFIPQLARKLLRVFCDQNSNVLDIFSGSGTTLLECKYLNIKETYGIELNPFANFIAKTKLDNISTQDITNYIGQIQWKYIDEKYKYETMIFKNINFWYSEKTIRDLSKLLSIILELDKESIRDFYLLCFCEISRKVSYLDHGGFKMYRSRAKINSNFNPNVLEEFVKTFNRNIQLLNFNNSIIKSSKTKWHIIQGDSRIISKEIKEESIDFILTSPPYGDSRTTVAYGQYSRLPWQWLSKRDDIIKLDSQLLGGNTKNVNENILGYSKKLKEQTNEIMKADNSDRVKDVISFYNDLYDTLRAAKYYLKKDHYFVLVTGNRTVKKVYLRTDIIISEFGEQLGFSTEKMLHRNIINKRMACKNSPTNEKGKTLNTMMTENIIILKKN